MMPGIALLIAGPSRCGACEQCFLDAGLRQCSPPSLDRHLH